MSNQLDSAFLTGSIEILHKIRTDLNSIMSKISQNNGSNDENSKENMKETMNKIISYLVELKLMNRESHLELDSKREEKKRKNGKNTDKIFEEKRAFCYEKVQLEKVIKNLRSFTSKFQHFEMISEEDFLKNAGEELNKFSNDHEKLINRFQYESQERKRLCTELETVKSKNNELKKRNEDTKKLISNIESKVKTIQQASSSLHEFAGTIANSVDSKQIQLAKNLPSPLYLLYFQSSQLIMIHPQLLTSVHISEGNEGSSDNFPYFVKLVIPSSKNNLEIHLSYQNNLHLIVVKAFYEDNAVNEWLVDLFTNDNGRNSPNPLHSEGEKQIYKDKRSGRAFKWAQSLAGISFLPGVSGSEATDPSYRNLESIIRSIQERVESRNELESELSSLSKGLLLGHEQTKTVATLKSWKDVTQVAKTKQHLDSRVFKAIYTNSNGETVEGHVEVKPNYPVLGSVRFEFQASPVFLNQKIEEVLKRISLVKETSPHLLSNLMREVLQEL
eukprot:TRINITY_DN2801_c0_g2_i1.p1 TRINITY_DN2801_c0_g2~~TRINITY_DN2801_c0_g2_i1.p1  ORF type:complete len:502 (+),score=182.56 TRINITY_DN2801_c0_g2_i1:29-1534(+)